MTKPLLSICIATYNRGEYIGETLESIILQVTDEVEIVIVDGASTDNTSTIVKGYVEVCKQINYILLPSKGGVDYDYDQAVSFAHGEYCWLFTDDDLLKPGAISIVLSEIHKGYCLIAVNFQVMNKDFSKLLSNNYFKINVNELYDELKLEQLFCRVVQQMSFIGCVIINRDLWLKRERKFYFGTEFIHIGVIFQAPLPSPALVVAEPYIIIRWGNAQWTARSFDIWMFKWPKLIWSFDNIPDKAKLSITNQEPWRELKNLFLHRFIGGYTIQSYRKYFLPMSISSIWKYFAFLIAYTPRWIARIGHYILKLL